MLKQEGNHVRTDLKNAFATSRLSSARIPAEPGIKKTSIVNPELTGTCVVWKHFRRVFGRYRNRLPCHEYIKLIRIQYQRRRLMKANRFPIFTRIIVTSLEINSLGMLLRPIADQGILFIGTF